MAAVDQFRAFYSTIPPITRAYITGCVITSMLVQLEITSPFQLYFHPYLIFQRGQIWRLLTTFLYHGSFGFNFLFNIIFTYRYCTLLENGTFRGRTADFFYMFLFMFVLMTTMGLFVNLLFLGHALTLTLVYIWSRQNPNVMMNFFGIFNFTAPYLPFVLFAFSFLLGNSVLIDLVGIGVGHTYYYLETVCPEKFGVRVLQTPAFIERIFNRATQYVDLDEDDETAIPQRARASTAAASTAQSSNAGNDVPGNVTNRVDTNTSTDVNGNTGSVSGNSVHRTQARDHSFNSDGANVPSNNNNNNNDNIVNN